jgi:hypothetical protein
MPKPAIIKATVFTHPDLQGKKAESGSRGKDLFVVNKNISIFEINDRINFVRDSKSPARKYN